MEINGVQICNVCMKTSEESVNTVFVLATRNGEMIHVCTSCIPHIIHGSGNIVKSNDAVQAEVSK